MNELALFAGAGGGILGGKLLGWRTVCAVEWESYPASVLCARQNDGILPPFPIWDDVQTFDGKPWRGIVDVVSGGFPCQDISAAGKGAGIDGERSGMWKEMARIICEVRPQYAFIENSPMLTIRGLESVLADLAKMGFDAEWGVLSAADVGANHERERIWVVAKQMADTRSTGSHEHKHDGMLDARKICGSISQSSEDGGKQMAITKSTGLERWNNRRHIEQNESRFGKIGWSVEGNWLIEPDLGRVAHGVAARVDRLKAIGNGQVPLCAATAWNILKGRLDA